MPLPGPQRRALESEADELYLGGAAGGGKTGFLVGLSLTEHTRSIIFRRQYADIGEIEDQVADILGSDQGYNQNRKRWRLPSDGERRRILEFGACQKPGSERAFMGRPHDLKAFDEVPQFTEEQYLFLSGWNRTKVPGQRCRIVAAGNPPLDLEGAWVTERWAAWLDPNHANPAKDGELRWYIRGLDGKDKEVSGPEIVVQHDDEGNEHRFTPKSRTFIRATTEDNPYLGEEYIATLQALPEPLRSMLLHGRFDATAADDPWQVIPSAWVDLAMKRWSETSRPEIAMSSLGVDVAHGGDDKTVLSPRWGNWMGEQVEYEGHETPDGPTAAAIVTEHLRDRCSINIDHIGWGASASEILAEQDDLPNPIILLVGSQKSTATDRTGHLKFVNKRAEWWWRLREALDPDHGYDVCLPPSRVLKRDLITPKWRLTIGGIKVESKEEFRERLKRSPDHGDSCVYAFAEDDLGALTAQVFEQEDDMYVDLNGTAAEMDWNLA